MNYSSNQRSENNDNPDDIIKTAFEQIELDRKVKRFNALSIHEPIQPNRIQISNRSMRSPILNKPMHFDKFQNSYSHLLLSQFQNEPYAKLVSLEALFNKYCEQVKKQDHNTYNVMKG